jgi:hypothetical protein
MSEVPMSPERFAALAETYGAQIRLWPETERAAALAFAETDRARAILREADRLDALLEQYRPPQPSVALRAAVAQVATAHAAKRQRLKWGFGLAGVGFAGLLAGIIVTAALAPAGDVPFQGHDLTVDATAFGDMSPGSDTSEEED